MVDEAAERLLVEDTSSRDFLTKHHDQLAGLSDQALTFVAELLYMHVLAISNMGVPAKRELVDKTLSWRREPWEVPDDLVDALEGGVANFGAALTRRDKQVRCFVGFAQAWVSLGDDDRDRLLGDPWQFRAFVHDLQLPALMQREAILHLAFPETFEYALAVPDKTRIRKVFNGVPRVEAAEDDDRALVVVRELVEDALGRPLNLYATWFQAFWRSPTQGQWPEALGWADRFYQSDEFAPEERDYKLVVGQRMTAAREALERGDEDWQQVLRAAFDPPNNFVHPIFEKARFLDWCDERPDEVAIFLRTLWSGDPLRGGVSRGARRHAGGSSPRPICPSQRLRSAAGWPRRTQLPALPDHGCQEVPDTCGRERRRGGDFGAGHLRGFGGGRLDVRRGNRGGHGGAAEGTDDADTYATFLTSLDELRVRLLARNVLLRDRLDAQSIVWMLAQRSRSTRGPKTTELRFAPLWSEKPPPPPDPVVTPGEVPDKAWLVRGANVDGVNLVPEWIEQGYVSIGWHELGSAELPATRKELAELVRDTYPDDPPGAWYAAAGNLNRFVNQMQPGHLVLTIEGDELYVGRVAGDVRTRPTDFQERFAGAASSGSTRPSRPAALPSRRRTQLSTHG